METKKIILATFLSSDPRAKSLPIAFNSFSEFIEYRSSMSDISCQVVIQEIDFYGTQETSED